MEELKGFIEVTEIYNGQETLKMVNINTISEFFENMIIKTTQYRDGSLHIVVKESYEEIKELIKNAQ